MVRCSINDFFLDMQLHMVCSQQQRRHSLASDWIDLKHAKGLLVFEVICSRLNADIRSISEKYAFLSLFLGSNSIMNLINFVLS
jgi:hypothetical protein